MASCPECGADVPEGAEVCAACGAELDGEAVAGRDCPNCGTTVPADAEACPACGELQHAVACATHPERSAAGVCVMCGRPVCEACDRGKGTEYVCEEHAVVPMTEGWAQVYTTGDDMEAELIRDNLLSEGIDSQVLSQKDHFSFTVDLGDLAQVRVLVPAFEYEDAMRVLSAHADPTRQLALACPTCGAAYAEGDATCGACGEPLAETGPAA